MMTKGDPEGRIFFYRTLTQIMDSLSCSPLLLFIYGKIQFHMMTILDVLGKIAWVR